MTLFKEPFSNIFTNSVEEQHRVNTVIFTVFVSSSPRNLFLSHRRLLRTLSAKKYWTTAKTMSTTTMGTIVTIEQVAELCSLHHLMCVCVCADKNYTRRRCERLCLLCPFPRSANTKSMCTHSEQPLSVSVCKLSI